MKDNSDAMHMLACLLFRCAHMVDHVEVRPNVWRYQPTRELLEHLVALVPSVSDLPTEAFLHYADAIALNEDVKYFTLGKLDDFKKGTGRINNLMTQLFVISVMIGKISVVELATAFSRLGVSPLSKGEALKLYPELQ